MCVFSRPSPPPPPPSPSSGVAARNRKAKEAKEKERKRLAKKKGGVSYLSAGYGGIVDTLLGSQVNKL